MTQSVLLQTNDKRFPPYFRLYWTELRALFDLKSGRKELRDELADILLKDTNDKWFFYAKEVFDNPEEALLRVTEDTTFGVKNAKKKTNGTPDESAQAEINIKKAALAELLCKNVFSTFVYEVLFNEKCIKHIDDFTQNNSIELWNLIHLVQCSEHSEAVKAFFQHFFPENNECMLDRLSVAFQNLNQISEIGSKLGFSNVICKDLTQNTVHKVRYFLRQLPHTKGVTEIWFYELIDVMVRGGHIAALSILLPDWDLVCKQKLKEEEELRNLKAGPRQKEDDIVKEDLLEMRLQKDFRKGNEFDYEETVQHLALYDYQEELIEEARQGKNTIIVAPTGAGKTEVAIYIAREHIEKREREKLGSRVVLLVPKIPLVEQQEARFRKYLKNKHVICGFHGAMNFTGEERCKEFLKADVIVMTPEILWNMIRTVRKNERIYLADISLLIFDEVHHCGSNHVYNRIMQRIHDYAYKDKISLQILGLTATPLPTAQTDERSALDAIYELMANTDCYHLSTVIRHMDSLEQRVAKPDEVFHKEDAGEGNSFSHSAKYIINKILKDIKNDLSALESERPRTTGSQITKHDTDLKYANSPAKFINSLNLLKDKLNKEYGQNDKIRIYIAIDYLLCIGRALKLDELMPCNFAIDYLNNEMIRVRDCYSNSTAQLLYNAYAEENYALERAEKVARNNWETDPKPIVTKLINVIKENFEQNLDTRCIIFVEERAMTKRLTSFLNDINVLGEYNTHKINVVAAVTSAKSGVDGITAEEQKTILSKFHRGEIKIIVSTSVLDEGIDVSACNLIIKYNISSSAVAKIQRAGRVRAKGGKSVFICLHEGVAASEYLAILTGNMMKKCVKLMAAAGPAQVKQKVNEKKIKLKNTREENKKHDSEKQERLRENRFKIACRVCETIICDADDLRVDGSHCCIVDPEIWKRLIIEVAIKKGAKFVDNEHQILGKIYCIKGDNIDDYEDYWKSERLPNRNECGTCVGNVYKIAGTYFPVLKTENLKFIKKQTLLDGEIEAEGKKSWKKVADEMFYIAPLLEKNISSMLHALDNEEAPGCQQKMKIKLDVALERVYAEFNREMARKKAEAERQERVRHGIKKEFDTPYLESNYTGFDDSIETSSDDEEY